MKHDVGLLVAAAGFGTSGPFLRADLTSERAMLATNCSAVVQQTHVFGQRFAERGRGGIVLFGSLVGWQGVPNSAHYAATKAYVQTLAEGIHVSAPGPVKSGFGARANMRMGAASTPETVARETLAALGRRGTVVPGLLRKFLTASLAPLPRSLRTRVMGGVMRGMTAHHDPVVTDRSRA